VGRSSWCGKTWCHPKGHHDYRGNDRIFKVKTMDDLAPGILLEDDLRSIVKGLTSKTDRVLSKTSERSPGRSEGPRRLAWIDQRVVVGPGRGSCCRPPLGLLVSFAPAGAGLS
jgi:hypothetical protein